MNYDLIVIGGGPAGYLACERAADAGLSVLCIEKEHLGGVCLNEGCIPTKTLLYSAKLFDGVAHGEKYGVTAENMQIDHKKIVARKGKVVKTLVAGIKSMLKSKGVTVVNGCGVIMKKDDNAFTVSCNEETFCAKHILLATGSSPMLPPIPGLSEGVARGELLTNREILALDELPERLVIVGGGVIGLEMASYFNSVGSKVTVIEMLPRIAGQNDPEMSEILRKNYEKKGVSFMLSTKVTQFTEGTVTCEHDGETVTIPFDKALLSIGRRANTAGVGLDTIGVAVERGAVVTDEFMQTSVPCVYAAGDVNGKSMLAHTAYREAEVAVNNILGHSDKMDYSVVPSVIYTNPELSSIGETEETAAAKGIEFAVHKLNMRFSGRYLAENDGGDGIFKLITDNTDRVIGAQALCNYSSEFIVSIGVMMQASMTLEQIRKVVFPHPTVCEIIREAVFE